MLVLGLVLLLLGLLAVVAAVFTSEPGTGGELLGFDVTTFGSFVLGLAAGAAILLGVSLMQRGTKRTVAHRRQRKELGRQNEQLLREQAVRDEKTVPIVDKRTHDDPPG